VIDRLPRPRPRLVATTLATVLASCALTPLSHRINVGEEPFLVFVGEGADRHTDLFAVQAGGGAVIQLTFTPQVEWHPRLAPDGKSLAFLRARDSLPTTDRQVVLMDLVTGNERTVTLPDQAGRPQDLGWSPDGAGIYIGADHGLWRADARTATAGAVRMEGTDSVRAVAALQIWLGHPPFARVIPCTSGGLCVLTVHGDTGALAPTGHDPVRWGDDSVGWFDGSDLYVRPLGPGVRRRIGWTNAPSNPHDATYAPGATPPADTRRT